jgi:hypothetical protein
LGSLTQFSKTEAQRASHGAQRASIGGKENKLIQIIENQGLKQLNKEPSHDQGGTIDHIYYQKSDDWKEPTIERYSPYYSDHDALCVTMETEENTDKMTPRTRQMRDKRKLPNPNL